jgi:hypothetical protein
MAEPAEGVRYFAAVSKRYGSRSRGPHPDRDLRPFPHVTYLRRVESEHRADARTRMSTGLSKNPNEIHTGNSAYGALGLAFHMRPTRIALLGVDGKGDGYFYDVPGEASAPGCLTHLPRLFRSALADLQSRKVQVVNGSPDSIVACFARTTPEKAVEWASAA